MHTVHAPLHAIVFRGAQHTSSTQVVRYGPLVAYVEEVFRPTVEPFLERVGPVISRNGVPGAPPMQQQQQRAGLDSRDMLRTPPLMAAPTSSPPACVGAGMTTPPSSPSRAMRSLPGAGSGGVIRAARNVFISPMGSAQVRCICPQDIMKNCVFSRFSEVAFLKLGFLTVFRDCISMY